LLGIVVCGVSGVVDVPGVIVEPGVDGVLGVDGVVVCGVVGAVVAGGLVGGGVVCARASGAAIKQAALQRTIRRFIAVSRDPTPARKRRAAPMVSGSGPTIQQPSTRASA
jgi:hypothetical protein